MAVKERFYCIYFSGLRRLGSSKSQSSRKVSTQSLRSEQSNDDEHSMGAGEVESPGVGSDENVDSPAAEDEQDQDYSKYMPWIKVRLYVCSDGFEILKK